MNPYCAAKFVVEGYTEALSTYITPFLGIKFSIIESGGIHTAFSTNVFNKFYLTKGQNDAYKPVLNQYLTSIRSRPKEDLERIYQPVEEVANLILACLENPDPPLRMRTSA